MHGDDDLPCDYFIGGDEETKSLIKTAAAPESQQSQKQRRSKYNVDFWEGNEDAIRLHLSLLMSKLHQKTSSLERDELTSIAARFQFSYFSMNSLYDRVFAQEIPRGCSVVVFSSSAIRCIELIKAFQKHSKRQFKIGKLFARHMKVEDQIHALQNNLFNVAVGTPSRINAVLERVPSIAFHIRYAIIDVHRDVKTRSIFDIQETARPLLDFLFRTMSHRPVVKVNFIS